jgi:ketosteroid isomerase-like protein
MTDDEARGFVDQIMALWREPVPDGPAGEDAFAACYAERLTVNGTPMSRADLVTRARSLQAAYSGINAEVLEVVAAPGRVVVAFLMHVRHTGPLPTSLGELPATGREAVARTIDILSVRDGRVTDIIVVADELGLLTQLGAVRLGGSSRQSPGQVIRRT